ncbi:hypothetical protein [Streptomyces sp. NPDC093225]|uniref:hypothetical protein n=1 Tax=Streptomyces sp. NPDC093225 TaxID=3366034 RepID=UPI0037FE1304
MAAWVPAAVAVGLGLWGLERGGSMWRDESVTYQVAHRTLPELWALLGHVDAVHGLYYFLIHGVFALWEGGLWALRLPSVLATAAAAAGVGALAHRLAEPRSRLPARSATGSRALLEAFRSAGGPGGRVVRVAWAGGRAVRAGGRGASGVVAGTAYAVLPPVQMYAQEGRSYALVAAAVVWATYALLRRRWASYTALAVVACWLHEFAVLALVAHAVGARRQRAWWRCAAVVLLCLVPLGWVSARQAGAQLGWLGRPGGSDWLAYAAAAAAGLWLVRGRDPRAVRVALPLLLLPAGVLLPVSLLHPWYVDRYVLFSLAGLALLVQRVRLVAVLVLLTLPWTLWLRTPDSRKDDALAVARAVRELARPGDAVVFLPSRRREWLLSSPDVYGHLRDVALVRPPAAEGTLQGSELPSERIRSALLAGHRAIALLDPPDQPRDPYPREAVKRQTLVSGFELCVVRSVHGARVALFSRPGSC